MKIICLLLIGLTGFPAFSFADSVDSISQFGITWTFDKKVPVGQFVTGDYYVVGPVTVVSVTPAPAGTGKEFRHGSMLNPPVDGLSAYDGRFGNGFRQELITKYPVELKPGDSLVSTISLEKGQTIEKLPGNESSRLRAAAVLTCLKEAVPPDSFRPGYCDQQKNIIHRTGEIHWDLLPSLAGVTAKPNWSLPQMERAFQRPWLDHVYNWDSRDVHPSENMPGYGREIAWVVSEAALQLCVENTQERKTKLCYGMIQVGIDNWAIAKRGKFGEAGGWISQGGFGYGRKFPIVFAAIMLQDPEMLQIKKNAPEAAFSEDQATEFGRTWTGANVRYTGQYPLCGQSDRGPYEQLWPGLWPGPGRTMSEGYRRASSISSSVGEALATRLMKAEKIWDYDPFFAYMDRWMYEDDTEQVRVIRTALGEDYENKAWCRTRHPYPGDETFIEEFWTKFRQAPGMAPVAEFRKEIDEQGSVKIGANREFLVNGGKVFPLMLFAQAKAQIQNAAALGGDMVNGKIPETLFAQADAQVQAALDIGVNTVFVNGDAGESTWAFHYGKAFMEKIAAKGLYGVLGADTEVFGHPQLLGITQEDQPDRPVTMIPGPPMPKKIDAKLINRRSQPHGGAANAFDPKTIEEGVLLDPMEGAEVSIKLEKPVTAGSFAVWVVPPRPNAVKTRDYPKEVTFLADGKEVLSATLQKEKGKQEFKLDKPVTFKELIFKVGSIYPGTEGYGFVKQIGAFDEQDRQVWLYDYDPELRSVEKVTDVYAWMHKMQKTRLMFLTLSAGFMPSSTTWDKETREAIYPGYLKQCDVTGFVLPPDSVDNSTAWLDRVADGVSGLCQLAGPEKPVVFWLGLPDATGVNPASLNPAQVRAAVWAAIIHGATAVGYRAPQEKNQMVMSDEMKAMLKQLNERIISLAPAILGNPARAKVEMTVSGGLQSACKSTESDGSLFIFAQNTGLGKDAPGAAQPGEPRGGKGAIHVEGLRAGASIEVVGEGRAIKALSGEFSDEFAPMAEHVYRLSIKAKR